MQVPNTLPVLAVLMAGACAVAHGPARAHDEGSKLSPRAQAEIAEVRRATAPFHDMYAAFAAGYSQEPVVDVQGNACIEQPGEGAMGVHYVNFSLLTPYLSPLQPQALIYEPMPGGTQRLVGAEYIVFKAAWDGTFPGSTPMLFGQHFHLVPEGNRYGLPAFYALHLWLWQPNRSGMFADWNPAVRCR